MVLAPYGILQSLVRERDLAATLDAVRRVLAPGGIFGIDLVPDVPNWREYRNRVQLRGRGSRRASSRSSNRFVRIAGVVSRCSISVISSARARGVVEHRFELTFRTLPIGR